MKTYLVGGAVRDRLLSLPVRERDWVVVGSTDEEMLRLGFQRVGRDFPVYLHPDTREEHALARLERKTGSGHTGFAVNAAKTVTLEEDLARRDLTINAIAEAEDGSLTDPLGGQRDIEDRCLRHVGPAFEEDPLRVLRLARFAAYLHDLGFTVAPETTALCRQMVARGDLTELSPERVFTETRKAMATPAPATYFLLLSELGADQVLWPEVHRDALEVLQEAEAKLSPEARFAVAFMSAQPEAVDARCRELRTPDTWRELAVLLAANHSVTQFWQEIDAETVSDLLYRTDAARKPARFDELVTACEVLDAPSDLGRYWREVFEVWNGVTRQDVDAGIEGPAIGSAIRELRLARVNDYLVRSRATAR